MIIDYYSIILYYINYIILYYINYIILYYIILYYIILYYIISIILYYIISIILYYILSIILYYILSIILYYIILYYIISIILYVTYRCASKRSRCDQCTKECGTKMADYRGNGHRCNVTADDADNGYSPRLRSNIIGSGSYMGIVCNAGSGCSNNDGSSLGVMKWCLR